MVAHNTPIYASMWITFVGTSQAIFDIYSPSPAELSAPCLKAKKPLGSL